MTFKKHRRSISIAASQRISILRESSIVFHDQSLLVRCFRGYVLPVLENRSAVYCSAADSLFRFLDSAVNGASFSSGDVQ